MLRGGRPLKRWRYIGVFCPELMACAAEVHVGGARQTFWAVLLRGGSELGADSRPQTGCPRRPGPQRNGPQSPKRSSLRERTRLLPRRGRLQLSPGRLQIHEDGVDLDLHLEEDAGWSASCPHGRGQVWTRKQAGVAASGTLAFDGASPRPLEALAVIDDTAGYHARVTEWWWAAGVGVDPQGRALAFNLVEGVNDPPTGSERAVWVDGVPSEAPTVNFARDLSSITTDDGSELRFSAEAERHRREQLLLISSSYRAPFGTFTGTLPGGIGLASGLGVMEHHRARW
jgi:Protein of unknown function (DUF2804)